MLSSYYIGELFGCRITISPPTNFLTKTPTIVKHDQHEFIFEGFSLLSHAPIAELPTCKVIRFNIEYTILYIEEKMPENFTIRELDLFCKLVIPKASRIFVHLRKTSFQIGNDDERLVFCSQTHHLCKNRQFSSGVKILDNFALHGSIKSLLETLTLTDQYLFVELLELLDFTLQPANTNPDEICTCFHFLPRFVRDLPDNGKEVLAMSEVIRYLLDCSGPLVPRPTLEEMMQISQNDWQNYVDNIKEMVVTNPGMRPCSVRVDQLDRNVSDLPECIDPDDKGIIHPVIVHFGIRPPQLSYAGNPEYQKAWREYVKFRHLVANMSKPSYEDKRKLEQKEIRLQEMRTQGRMKRNITVAVSSKGFYRTGIMCDIIQHALLSEFRQTNCNGCRLTIQFYIFSSSIDHPLAIPSSFGCFGSKHRLQVSESLHSPISTDSSVVQRKFRHKSRPCPKQSH